MTDVQNRIAVLGGGSWGATLANHLANNGHAVTIWEFVPEVAVHLQKTRSLKTLPMLKLNATIVVTNDMAAALKDANVILSVVPSHTVRSTFERAKGSGVLKPGALVISASKGIENETYLTMSQVIKGLFPEAGDIVILSGPSHAEEVAMGQPVALVAASASKTANIKVQSIFAAEKFRIYTSDDPIGVELGGALKNIYAVATGIIDGLQYGDNTKAALMTRGLLEMTRIGNALGAKTVTFFGLSGLGDMIVTCGSQHSRNRMVGEKVGSGKTLEQAMKEMTMVAEGVTTAKSAYNLARAKNVEVPIINEIYRVLFENKSPKGSIKDLLAREVGAEMEGIVL
jgi:glycerol-3-phosphate dehydrogenase (NAD(P)+)